MVMVVVVVVMVVVVMMMMMMMMTVVNAMMLLRFCRFGLRPCGDGGNRDSGSDASGRQHFLDHRIPPSKLVEPPRRVLENSRRVTV